MRISSDAHEKMMSLYQLTQGVTLSVDTFEHLHVILKGIHPKLDEKLEICSGALRTLQKIQSVDVITLTAEGLPEDTEEKRKRKKALIFFISSIKNLKVRYNELMQNLRRQIKMVIRQIVRQEH